MEEQQTQESSSRKRTRQQISVPFLWEEKPGMPKKEWAVNSPPTDPLPPPLLPPPPPQPSLKLLPFSPNFAVNSPPSAPQSHPSPQPSAPQTVPAKLANSTPPGAPLPSRPPPPPPQPSPPPPVPAKFVVSVPFKWEEKPGTPLRTFAQEPLLAAENKGLPLPPAYSQFFDCFESDEGSSSEDDEQDELDWLTELDLEASSSQTAESSRSAPSLLANRLVSASRISSAIPFDNQYQMKQDAEQMELEAPSSPESESSTSSYATGNTSPLGNSILEQLFPLYMPKTGSPGKRGCSNEKNGCPESGVQATETQLKVLRGEGEQTIVIRRPPTLGELIMLSRRRSYLQKAVRMRKNSLSKGYEEQNGLGCCKFGAGNGGIAKLLGRKSFLTIKFA